MDTRILTVVTGLTLCMCLASPMLWAAESQYQSLEHFCVTTNADTKENCACGQATADEIMTPEEQHLVLGLMADDPVAKSQVIKLGDQLPAFMQKVELITAGCS